MLELLALPLGAVVGFVAARRLRRPRSAAQAAAVARTVSGSLGRRKGLAAPDLQRACFSEMVRHLRTGPDGTTVAPSRYLLRLHPDDLAVVDDARGWFTEGLQDAMADAARSDGWQLAGPLDIRYEPDPDRRPGVPAALAVDPRPAPVPVARRGLALAGAGGAPMALGDEALTIGRGSTCDLVVDDARVSRHHATVGRGRGGWVLTDVGSSNGTTLNGKLLTPNVPQPIRAGDAIGVGPTQLQVIEVDA